VSLDPNKILFSLSYRDVEELLAERGLHADHVTVWRWVQREG
jgi:IS6 family transposase